jgi:urea transport system ATP-binding protein
VNNTLTRDGPLLAVVKLNQAYAGSHILKDVDIVIERGSVTALMGRNGVGKTTFLKTLLGLLPSLSGTVCYRGMDITQWSTQARARGGIGYVPQGRMIFPTLTVEENLRVAVAARGDKRSTIPVLVFELFPVLSTMLQRRGGDLSGGQQQQLAIARALTTDPDLLILDEPCEGIQPSIVQEIGEAIKTLQRELGMTVVIVEQRLRFVRSVASNFYIMERGQIRANGSLDSLSDELIGKYLTV